MNTDDIEAAMDRASAALGRECRSHTTDRNLMRPTSDGWWAIGTINIPEEHKAWQVYFHSDTGRGWMWEIHVLEKGVQPRRFEPPA